MPDTYIDIFECVEYCTHLADEVLDLVGVCELVDAKKLSKRARGMADSIQSLLDHGKSKDSTLRGHRASIELTSAAGIRIARRFHGHLIAVEEEVTIDFEAFYADRKLGNLSHLKPADVEKVLSSILRGFHVPANAALPDKDKWRQAITGARDALAAAIGGRGSARKQSITMTAELSAAREKCLSFYNGTAKRLVYAALNDAGRLDEYRLFFLDLQVHEGGRSKASQEPQQDTPPDGGVPSASPDGITAPSSPISDPGPETA